MVALTTIFPIVFLIFVGVLFFIIFRAGKKYFTMKVTHWLLLIYISVLVLASVTVAFVPKESYKQVSYDEKMMDKESNEMYSLLSKGELTKLNQKNLIKKETIPFESSQKLRFDIRSDYHPQIYLEKKQVNDDQIEAYVYSNRILVSGIDVTEIVEPYHIRMYDESLVITSVFQELNLSIISENFAVRQFSGNRMLDHSYNGREQVIYLRVPRDIEIVSGDIFLEYVNRKDERSE